MARTDTLGHFLTDVADAIRTKKGTQATIQASNFDTEIENLPSGSSVPDWSQIGYSDVPQTLIDKFNYSKYIYDNWEPLTDLTSKFMNNITLEYVPLIDTSITNNMTNTFSGCERITTIPLLDTSNVTIMVSTFAGCSSLKTIPLLNTSNVTNISGIFQRCSSLTAVPLLNTSNVTNASAMFYQCSALTTIPLLNTSSVTNMTNMFYSCPKLTDTSLDNILQMCIGATSYIDTKSLTKLGFKSTSYPTSRIQALPHYQDFIDAGWTIGY